MQRLQFRWVLLVVAVVLGSGGVVSYRSHRIDKAWRQMIATGRELEQAMDSADHRRPVLHGESIEGPAHIEYDRAGSLLSETAVDDWVEVQAAAEKKDGSDIPLRDTLVEEHRAMLEALDLGARHTDARIPVEWQSGYNATLPRLMTAHTVANIAVLAAVKRLDEGNPEAAVDHLLDAMQYGRDYVLGPTWVSSAIGGSVLSIASVHALCDRGLLERIPKSGLLSLARGMELLESELPTPFPLPLGDSALVIRSFENVETSEESWTPSGEPVQEIWRYGFSKRLVMSDYATEMLHLQEVNRTSGDQAWPDLRRIIQDEIAHAEERGNPIGYPSYGAMLSILQSGRSNLARFRMARIAVQYRLSGELLSLADPFGSQLQTSETSDSLRIASAGPGAEDQNSYHTVEIALNAN